MDDERSIRLQAGCAILALFDLLALCVLLYLALMAGLLVPMDCAPDNLPACDEGRASGLRVVLVAFLTTIAVNVGFAVWAVGKRSTK